MLVCPIVIFVNVEEEFSECTVLFSSSFESGLILHCIFSKVVELPQDIKLAYFLDDWYCLVPAHTNLVGN